MTSHFIPTATRGDTVSPAELILDLLQRLGPPDVTSVVGPANDAQQQAGVASLTDAGLPDLELYLPVVSVRTQVRCIAGDPGTAEQIARSVQAFFHDNPGRVVARMKSTDKRYLVHRTTVQAGPSMHWDSQETWEYLLFIESLIGTDPIEPDPSVLEFEIPGGPEQTDVQFLTAGRDYEVTAVTFTPYAFLGPRQWDFTVYSETDPAGFQDEAHIPQNQTWPAGQAIEFEPPPILIGTVHAGETLGFAAPEGGTGNDLFQGGTLRLYV